MKIYELIKHLEVLPDQQAEIYMFDGEYGPKEIIGVDDERADIFPPTGTGTLKHQNTVVKCII